MAKRPNGLAGAIAVLLNWYADALLQYLATLRDALQERNAGRLPGLSIMHYSSLLTMVKPALMMALGVLIAGLN